MYLFEFEHIFVYLILIHLNHLFLINHFSLKINSHILNLYELFYYHEGILNLREVELSMTTFATLQIFYVILYIVLISHLNHHRQHIPLQYSLFLWLIHKTPHNILLYLDVVTMLIFLFHLMHFHVLLYLMMKFLPVSLHMFFGLPNELLYKLNQMHLFLIVFLF